MHGDCSNSWQAYGCEWSIGNLWHSTYLLERLVLLLLAIMLGRIVLIVVRLCYVLSRRPKSTDTKIRALTALAAELRVKLRSLRSILSTAPFLGLSGTSLGILDTLSGGFTGSRYSFLASQAFGIAAAFLSTAAGILVAVTATCLHNYLRMRVDLLESEFPIGRVGKTRLPLRPRVSAFPFPLTAVPILVLSIATFMIFPSFYGPRGLRVRLVPTGASEKKASSLEPIVIAVVSTRADALPTVYVNSNKTAWDELRNRLQSELEECPGDSIVYVQADKDVFWQHVIYVTDVAIQLHANVVLLTIKPDIHRRNL
jgi:biopolymer transport protein ExbD